MVLVSVERVGVGWLAAGLSVFATFVVVGLMTVLSVMPLVCVAVTRSSVRRL